MAEKITSVFVAILSGGGMLHGSHGWLAYHLPFWSHDPKIPYTFAFWIEGGTKPQEYARNCIIGRFLQTKCEVLIMIDDDMVLSGSILDLLATPEYDIAGPLQYMFLDIDPSKDRTAPQFYPCAFNFDTTKPMGKQIFPVWPTEPNGSSRVEAVGSGVIAIRRHVLEDPKMHLEPDMDPPAIFRNCYHANAERYRGLDIDFCWRAKEAGYRTMVNWSVNVGHYKRLNLNDVDLYAKAQFALGANVRSKNNAIRLEGKTRGKKEASSRSLRL